MKSTHTYTAAVLDDTEASLSIRGGAITIDDTGSPYVEATIDVPLTDEDTLALLDPRQGGRVRIDASSTTATSSRARSFDLSIRSRQVRQRDGVCTLRLASDEAIVMSSAPLEDDHTPYTLQGSIRAIINYVLESVDPAMYLQASGAYDRPMLALTDSVNVVRNPRAKDNLGDWYSAQTLTRYAGGGTFFSPSYVNVQAAVETQLLVNYHSEGVPVRSGETYRVGVDLNALAGTSVGFDVLVLDADGATLADTGDVVSIAPGGWDRSTVTITPPAGATRLQLRAFTTGAVPAGTSLNVTGWRVSLVTLDPTDTEFFDGSGGPFSGAVYAYAYDDEGQSIRTALIDRADDLLVWRAGVSGMHFLVPMLQSLGLRLVCDEHREWTLRDESYTAEGAVTIRYGVNLVNGEDTVSIDDGDYFDAAVVIYTWRGLDGVERKKIDDYSAVEHPMVVRTFERDTPFPGFGFAEYLVRRAATRGRQVTATAVADWTVTAEQSSEFTLLGSPVQSGTTSRVVFDLDRDEMTITSRTTDTVPGAIDFLTGTIDELTGTIDEL